MATNVTVKGVECVSNLAGRGALSLATFLVAVLKDQKRTQGKTRMKAFHGKPTKVFVIKAKDMKAFAEEAKKYGILYAAVINKKQPDGIIDVVVNANDAAKVDRIAERFALSTVDVDKIRADIEKTRAEKAQAGAGKERTTPPAEKEAHTVDERTLHEMVDPAPQKMEHKQPADVTEKANPTKARTERSSPSAPISNDNPQRGGEISVKEGRPSVRQQIKEMRQERQAQKAEKQPERGRTQQPVHKQPTKKKSKSKER